MRSLKLTTKYAVSSTLRNPAVWFGVQSSLGKAGRWFSWLEHVRRWNYEEQDRVEGFRSKCRKAFSDMKVLNGPFEGMIYPSMSSHGSSLYPKLLGSYEGELHGVLETMMSRGYDAIVDIGCAEGYYAVGLGRRMPQARVYAYDTNAAAVQQCVEMARMNGVEVTTGGFCDQAVLKSLDLGKRALIISDCEGYENELLDASLATALSQHDFLVETHDFIQIESTRNMLAALEATHDCTVIDSIDDIHKAYAYDQPQLANFDLTERHWLLAEYRPAIMRWVFASSRVV